MTSGFGVDRSSDGLSGTSSEDIRRIFGGLYTPGIVVGCAVSHSTTDMRYDIAPGVVSIKTAEGEIVLAPIDQKSVYTTDAPTEGSRIDIIYAQQRYPSIEGDAEIFIGVSTTLPSRAVQIASFQVNANTTTTSEAVATSGPTYSIPYGGTLGELHYYTLQNSITLPEEVTRYGFGEFTLPTDRLVEWTITACLSSVGAYGFDNGKYCEYGFLPSTESGDFVLWTTPGLHQAWQTVTFRKVIPMTAGRHLCNFGILRMAGPGTGMSHFGTDAQGFGRPGIEFRIMDVGPVV